MNENAPALRRIGYATPVLPMRTVYLPGEIGALMYGDLPEALISYPSMMSIDEKRMLYNLAKNYSGEGLIVDAGIFLGASSNCFGRGVAENPATPQATAAFGKFIHSFDLGIVNPGMPSFFKRHGIGVDAPIGQSFGAFLSKAIAPVEQYVDLHLGDIVETIKVVNKPVEIAFIDVLKLPVVSIAVLEKVFPLLIPGKSIVIQQDYFNEHLEFVKTHQESFDHYFSYEGEIGCSAVFKCKRRITEKIANTLLSEMLDAENQIRLATIAAHRSIDPARRFLMNVSKARLINRLSGGSAALAYLDRVKEEFPDEVIGGGRLKRLAEVVKTAELLFSKNTHTGAPMHAKQVA